MSGRDDPWVEMLSSIDDGDDRVARVLTALRQPASPEELAGELVVVPAMQAEVLARPTSAWAQRRRRRLAGKVAAAKGVALAGMITVGVAAAAASSGIVDVERFPTWVDRGRTEAPEPAVTPVDDAGAGAGGGADGHGGDEDGDGRDSIGSGSAGSSDGSGAPLSSSSTVPTTDPGDAAAATGSTTPTTLADGAEDSADEPDTPEGPGSTDDPPGGGSTDDGPGKSGDAGQGHGPPTGHGNPGSRGQVPPGRGASQAPPAKPAPTTTTEDALPAASPTVVL